eukprot:3707751-Rhodomonas_salina.1
MALRAKYTMPGTERTCGAGREGRERRERARGESTNQEKACYQYQIDYTVACAFLSGLRNRNTHPYMPGTDCTEPVAARV